MMGGVSYRYKVSNNTTKDEMMIYKVAITQYNSLTSDMVTNRSVINNALAKP